MDRWQQAKRRNPPSEIDAASLRLAACTRAPKVDDQRRQHQPSMSLSIITRCDRENVDAPPLFDTPPIAPPEHDATSTHRCTAARRAAFERTRPRPKKVISRSGPFAPTVTTYADISRHPRRFAWLQLDELASRESTGQAEQLNIKACLFTKFALYRSAARHLGRRSDPSAATLAAIRCSFNRRHAPTIRRSQRSATEHAAWRFLSRLGGAMRLRVW
jgi:hypothetical protein